MLIPQPHISLMLYLNSYLGFRCHFPAFRASHRCSAKVITACHAHGDLWLPILKPHRRAKPAKGQDAADSEKKPIADVKMKTFFNQWGLPDVMQVVESRHIKSSVSFPLRHYGRSPTIIIPLNPVLIQLPLRWLRALSRSAECIFRKPSMLYPQHHRRHE